MVVATAANTPQTRACPACGAPQTAHLYLLREKDKRKHRFLVMGLIQIRGTVIRAWTCDNGHVHDGGTKFVEVPAPEPVREHIVFRLKGLREKGWRFFEWEK